MCLVAPKKMEHTDMAVRKAGPLLGSVQGEVGQCFEQPVQWKLSLPKAKKGGIK